MNLKIKAPWASSPKESNKYEIRFKYRDGRLNIHLFNAKYAAQKFILAVIHGRDYSWIDTDRLRVDDVRIECTYLEAIMSHTMTADEKAWVIPIPYSYYATYIRTGEAVGAGDKSSDDAARDTKQAPAGRPVRSSGDEKRKRVRNASGSTGTKRLQSSEGTTFGIPELVEATGKDASKIRAALRKSGIEKPAAGWVWDIDQKDTVLKAIKKFLK